MTNKIDWEEVRRLRYSDAPPPPEWPQHLRVISIKGTALLAIDPRTNELFWDGERLITAKRLATYERVLATVAAAATVAVALVEIGRSTGLWD